MAEGQGYIEIERRMNVEPSPALDLPCRGCGRTIRLWLNGGELDEKQCCGYRYELTCERIDLVVSKKAPQP